jgi:hypothetical protein
MGGFRLAMTFDVTGNNIVAGGFGNNFCDNIQSGLSSEAWWRGLPLRTAALPGRVQ